METLPIKKWPKQCFGGFWIRLAAFLIDSLLVHAVTKIVLNLTVHHLITPEEAIGQWWYSLLKLVLILAYFTLTTLYLKGQTVGKYLLHLKVVCFKTGKADRQTIILREVAGRTILNVIPLVAVILVVTRHRQHLVDLLCDTAVINLKQVAYYQQVQSSQPLSQLLVLVSEQ